MFGLSLAEIAVILLVAILVIGPKELPTVIRALVKVFRQIRGVISDCKDAFDEAVRESEFADLKEDFKGVSGRIIDLDGNEQETYDITDELAQEKTKRPKEPRDDG